MISIKNKIMSHWLFIWDKRNPREKNLIVFSGLLLLLVSWIYFLTYPAIRGIENAEEKIREARIQYSEITRLANLIPNPSSSPDDPKLFIKHLETTMIGRGFVNASISNTEDSFHVEIGICSFESLISWLLEAQRSENLFVANAIITRKEDPKFVKVSLNLQKKR